jgi:hypothetical protein
MRLIAATEVNMSIKMPARTNRLRLSVYFLQNCYYYRYYTQGTMSSTQTIETFVSEITLKIMDADYLYHVVPSTPRHERDSNSKL